MDYLSIEISLVPETLMLQITFKNRSAETLVLGGLNEQNIFINPVGHQKDVRRCFPSGGPLNDNGTWKLAPGATEPFDYDILSTREFAAAGRYATSIFYSTLGYRKRFARGIFRKWFGLRHSTFERWTGLELVHEIKAISEFIEFTVSDEQLAINRQKVAEARTQFWGRLGS